MTRLSSNTTLFLKIFLPTFWISFFTLVTLVVFFFTPDDVPLFQNWFFRSWYLFIYISFLLLFYFTFMRIQRVEFNGEVFLVSNYLKTYNCSIHDIEKLVLRNYFIFRTGNLVFHKKTKLGKKVKFILSKAMFSEALNRYPQLLEIIDDQGNVIEDLKSRPDK